MPTLPVCSHSPPTNYRVEMRADGAIVVRIPSTGEYGERLPDAVFSFRRGEPQYGRWANCLNDNGRRVADEARV